MSGFAYAGLGVAAAVLLGGFGLWLAVRSARKEGGAKAESQVAAKVADNARTSAAVRSDVAGVDDAAARERLSKWTRK